MTSKAKLLKQQNYDLGFLLISTCFTSLTNLMVGTNGTTKHNLYANQLI